jgi:hypothetical protein
LHAHLVPAIQEFFGVPDFRHIIVLVDVNAELNFLQTRAGWLFVLRVFGNVVSEFSEIDNLAHRRIGGGRDFDQIESKSLRFAQGVVQPHNAELFARGSQNDPDFASANPAVYTNLWLQIRSISSTVERECAAPPCSIYRNFGRQHPQTPGHSFFPAAAIHRDEVLALNSQAEEKL